MSRDFTSLFFATLAAQQELPISSKRAMVETGDLASDFISQPIRSRKPHKQLLYRWVDDALVDSANYTVCLDLACGDMRLYRHRRVRSVAYVGVDADRARLERAASKSPGARPVVSRIEDIGPDITGDLVVCIETIGINADFDVANTLLAVRKCVSATRAKLILNVGHRSVSYQPAVAEILRANFEKVEAKFYGRFRTRLPIVLSSVLASAMRYLPRIAAARDKRNVLFVCEKRRTGGDT